MNNTKDMYYTVEQYIKKNTNHAIQIAGNWGIGKTHYYNKILEPKISETNVISNAEKNYKPVYVSLFGMKSVDDIATKIVFDFFETKAFGKYSKTKESKKVIKITQGVLKIALRGFMNYHKLGNVNDYLTDVKTVSNHVLDTSELFICFDDLERKDSNLKIKDFIGYVNSLVDEGVKVLLILNEDKLEKEEVDVYKELKEKVVGITIPFSLDASTIISDIINDRYGGYPFFKSFIIKNSETVDDISLANQNNFRNIIYGLDVWQECYSLIKTEILDTQKDEKNAIEEELSNIMRFTMAIAIEFKLSFLKHTNVNELMSRVSPKIKELTSSANSTSQNDSLAEAFHRKYYPGRIPYHFYRSIFLFCTTTEKFDTDSFLLEFRNVFNLDKGKKLSQYVLFESLLYHSLDDISDDEEYQKKLYAILDYAKNGSYKPSEYINIMHMAERFDNFLELDLGSLRGQLIDGMKLSLAKRQPQISSIKAHIHTVKLEAAVSEHVEIIEKELLQEVDNLTVKTDIDDVQKLSKMLLSHPIEFEQHYHEYRYDVASKFAKVDVFSIIKPDCIMQLLYNQHLNIFYTVRNLFVQLYEDYGKKDMLEGLSNLTVLLKDYSDSLLLGNGNKIRGYLIRECIKPLMKILENH